MPDLTIKLTEKLYHELRTMASSRLVAAEDEAGDTISFYVMGQKKEQPKKPGLLGLDLAGLGQLLQVLGAQISAAAREKGAET